jgi:hypothetical protein
MSLAIGNLSSLIEKSTIVALGIEGSANKIGVGESISSLY